MHNNGEYIRVSSANGFRPGDLMTIAFGKYNEKWPVKTLVGDIAHNPKRITVYISGGEPFLLLGIRKFAESQKNKAYRKMFGDPSEVRIYKIKILYKEHILNIRLSTVELGEIFVKAEDYEVKLAERRRHMAKFGCPA